MLSLQSTLSLTAWLLARRSAWFWAMQVKTAPLSADVATNECEAWNVLGPGPKLWPFLAKVRLGIGFPPLAVHLISTDWPARNTATSSDLLKGSLSTLSFNEGSPGGPFDFEQISYKCVPYQGSVWVVIFCQNIRNAYLYFTLWNFTFYISQMAFVKVEYI